MSIFICKTEMTETFFSVKLNVCKKKPHSSLTLLNKRLTQNSCLLSGEGERFFTGVQ